MSNVPDFLLFHSAWEDSIGDEDWHKVWMESCPVPGTPYILSGSAIVNEYQGLLSVMAFHADEPLLHERKRFVLMPKYTHDYWDVIAIANQRWAENKQSYIERTIEWLNRLEEKSK